MLALTTSVDAWAEAASPDGGRPFIACVLIPEADREEPNVLFVGEAISGRGEPAIPEGSPDPVLNRLMFTMRAWYSLEFLGNEEARVRIVEEGTNRRVDAVRLGEGYFRVPDGFVFHGGTYAVIVDHVGGQLQGRTTVPDSVQLSPRVRQDTALVAWRQAEESGRSGWFLPIEWSEVERAVFYRVEAARGYSKVRLIDHTFDSRSNISYTLASRGLESTKTALVVEAVDSEYARIYRAGSSFTYTGAFRRWFKKWNAMDIAERSNIAGMDNAIGVVGSISCARAHFVATLVNDAHE